VPRDIFGPWPDKPAYLDKTKAWVKGSDGRPAMRKKAAKKGSFDINKPGLSYDKWIQQVNECMMAVDEGVGRVLKALEDSGQLANTLVVYSADQGYGLGEHGFNQKVAPYDSTIASPLIISRPGTLPEGKVCRHPVNSPDLVDLFCRTAGVKVPWKMHGRDITPLLRDPETKEWNSPMLFTHTARSYGSETDAIPTDERLTATSETPWYVLLRDGQFKYIRHLVAGEIEELYDLDADPEELVNLAVKPEHRDRLQRLRDKTLAELRRTGAKFCDAMPPTRAKR
jgi:arylsulfatase A-like enzyme